MPIQLGPDAAKPKNVGAVIRAFSVKGNGSMKENSLQVMAAEAFLSAVDSGDAQAVYDAFFDMFQLCEMQPHSEYEAE